MKKFIVSALILFVSNFAWAVEPVIKDTVPPCDNSSATSKPPCSTDSDSINIPPKTPDNQGVIVPPEIPPQGLPNQAKPQKPDVMDMPVRPNGNEMK